jgi:DNA invertase Pin-like site-specific DNA recombinase
MYSCVIFAAVSTPSQAGADRYSLSNQVEQSRQAITARSWREACPPIVVPGESRTELISLSDAAREIPQLGQLLDLARSGAVNLVVVYDFNRFRVLIQQVAHVLAAYGCQLYSVSQPVEPLPPAQFLEQQNDAARIVQGVSQLVSDLQISSLRRHFRAGMPRRITDSGLPWGRPRYGYRKPPGHESDRKAVPEQVPQECAVLQRMRRLFLDGESANAIARRLTREGVPSPRGRGRWQTYTVLSLLCSPFYAGYVYHGAERTRLDPLTRKRRRERTGKLVLARGQHEPLWSDDDWRALLERRSEIARGNAGVTKLTHKFSRLVFCDRCGSLMRAARSPRKNGFVPGYVCITDACPRHEYIRESALLPAVREALATAITHVRATHEPLLPDDEAPQDISAEMERAAQTLKALPGRRARYQRAYGDGLMTYEEFSARTAELEREESDARRELARLEDLARETARQAGRRDALSEFLAQYDSLAAGPDVYFNTRLAWLVAEVRVRARQVVRVRLR